MVAGLFFACPHAARAATNAVLLDFRQQIECTHPRQFLTPSNGLELPVQTTLRTRERAAALVRLMNDTVLRVSEQSELEILDPEQRDESPLLHLLRGSLFSHRRKAGGGVRVRAGAVNAITTGTDFEMAVEDGRAVFRVFDGGILVSNELGAVVASNGWQIVVAGGAKPSLQPIVVTNLVQWWLRFPAALDLRELIFTSAERQRFAAALAAWEAGNICQAIEAWPAEVLLDSPSAKCFGAAVELAAGRVERAEALLKDVDLPAADGTRAVIAAVKQRDWTGASTPASPSAWLGLSWLRQSRRDIPGALEAARSAAAQSPQWGAAWARVAELEFSSGKTRHARQSLERALHLAPEHAAAYALRGFTLAAEGRRRAALEAFDEALRLDGLLGDAWLGRGLCLIQSGRAGEGRVALQNAVGAEPERSLIRSYLGKAWDEQGDSAHAREELKLAQRLDPGDPTPWLYSALQNEREHRYNQAVRDLEHSIALNDNRAVYRSELLLDQDRAVRGANLARLYDRAGLTEVGVREASRAVGVDYANWASHLFLAESYDALRDPARVNLRYETPWFGELMLARLLAPAAAGAFSQNLSQQEYTRLFEANRLGLNSSTEWRSDGRWRERATQFGIRGGTSWAVDLDWEHRDERAQLNNDLERLEVWPQFKQQVTASDSLLAFAKIYDYRAGDVRQLENSLNADRTLRSEVSQMPIAGAGWHHEWSPGVHTLLLGARLEDDQRVRSEQLGAPWYWRPTPGPPWAAGVDALSLDYRGRLEIWSGELNQIVQVKHHTLVAGVRAQAGEFDTRDALRTNVLTGNASFFNDPAASGQFVEDFSRLVIYGYDHFAVMKRLLLIGGVAYDRLEFPRNFAAPPVSEGTRVRDLVGPKGGLVWTPIDALTLRGMYAQTLGGASFDESLRLEPTQLAGFAQAYRSLLPESAGGGGSAQFFDLWGLAADVKLSGGTFLGFEGGRRTSEEANTIGAFELGGVGNYTPVSMAEDRRFEETVAGASVHQLFGDDWAAGAGWRWTDSELRTRHPLLPASVGAVAASEEEARLHELWLRVVFNHPSGFFARGEVASYWQKSTPSGGPSRDEAVCEMNLFAGWRFKRQRGEVSAGLLNLTDQDHRLNPLNGLAEVPRERVFVARLRLNF